MAKDADETKKLLKSIDEKLAKMTSRKEVFIKGLINGVAVAIGTTIVAAVGLSILSRAVNSLDDVPILQQLADEIKTTD